MKTTPVAAGFLEKASAHALTQAKKTLQSHLIHIVVQPWIWVCCDQEECSKTGHRDDSVPGWHCVGWWPLLELTQASHRKQPVTLTVASLPQFTHWYMPSVHVGPAFPVVWFHKRVRWQRLGGIIGYERQRGLGSKTASEQSEGNICWPLPRQCIRDSPDLSTANTS